MSKNTLNVLLDKAQDCYRQNDISGAVAYYDKILAKHPDNYTALEWRGELAIQRDEYEIAANCLEKAAKLNPDTFSDFHNLGLAWYELNQPEKAVIALKKAIDRNPNDDISHSNFGKALYEFHQHGDRARAQSLAKSWFQKFPTHPDARHMGSAIAGVSPPPQANTQYVKETFDDYAVDFDEKIAELDYKVPSQLKAFLDDFFADDVKNLKILDAGCGTGLCCPLLRPYADKITGVDLSAKMLAKARKKGGYDTLIHMEISAFLHQTPQNFDLVIAADMLCYFGQIQTFLAMLYPKLSAGGLFIFSVEANSDNPDYFALGPSGRYQHGANYLATSLEENGFLPISLQKVTLRFEHGQPVKGFLIAAGKND